MEPAEFTRVCLAHFREQGVDFVTAWTRTLQAIPRGSSDDVARQRREWMRELKWARPAFEAAYLRVELATILERDARRRRRGVTPEADVLGELAARAEAA